MKIIHVTQFLGIGGLEKIIFHLIKEQMLLGHEVSLYVYDHDQEWVPYFRENGIKVITPPIKKPGIDISLFTQFNKDLMKCDVIHTHDMNPIFYISPLILLRRLLLLKRPRFIHTTHGMAHVERVPKYFYIERFLTPIADKIICVSKKLENYYIEKIKVSTKKVVCIENGIKTLDVEITKDLKNEKRNWLVTRHNLDSKKPILLCLSRILPLKNQLFLIEAMKLRPNYQLILAGPPSDQNYYDQLISQNIRNVYIVGAQSEVLEYNLGADLFVSASTHEGIPVAVLEAMSCETPCLVSRIPGHETLNNYGNCIDLFSLTDQNEFLKKCDQLLKTSNNYEKVKLALTVVNNNFSVNKMVEKYLMEYQK